MTGYRRLNIRYDRKATHFPAFLTLAATLTTRSWRRRNRRHAARSKVAFSNDGSTKSCKEDAYIQEQVRYHAKGQGSQLYRVITDGFFRCPEGSGYSSAISGERRFDSGR
ncbi:hypothetical protein ACQP1G_17230 [Nocardia sp. CA-107356]|uniref:hypothetical protein n=1 Tax=Nocardia sp. CA-107356 TaxID=3239972 RepID=UPI003D8D85C9